jgi:hypothetical protein
MFYSVSRLLQLNSVGLEIRNALTALNLDHRNHAGPTMLIIKDKDGYIYGGYASQQWERHAEFYGDMKCYIFQLNPKASIFRPTGANTNLQWVKTYLFLIF